MKKNLLTLFSIVLIIGTTCIYGYTNKSEGYDYNAIEERIKTINPFIPFWTLNGLRNGIGAAYHDLYVESYEDLVLHSDYIFMVQILEDEQWGGITKTSIKVTKIFKDISDSYDINDHLSLLQMKYIYVYEDSAQLFIDAPYLLKNGEQYVVFLNKVDLFDNVFRFSTMFYSAIYANEVIKVIEVNEKKFEKVHETGKETYLYSKFSSKDYVYSNYVEWAYSDIQDYDDDEKEIALKGLELYINHFELYQKIAKEILSQIGIVPEFEVVEYSH